jgi:tetratricopeptide (TPR) repeat protein
MGQYDEALADFDRAIALDDTLAWALACRGETHRLMGQYDAALADFDRAIALDEKFAWALACCGETYRRIGKYDAALADFDRAIALDEKFAWVFGTRGETYRQMGQYAEALADFDRAIAVDEKYPWAFGRRGEMYQQMGRYDEALANLDRAIALDQRDWYFYNRALTHRLLNNDAAAGADLVAAIALAQEKETKEPDDWQNRLNLAIYYVSMGNEAKARSRYTGAIAARVCEETVRDAVTDLDDYLRLFPADRLAAEMRDLMRTDLAERGRDGR